MKVKKNSCKKIQTNNLLNNISEIKYIIFSPKFFKVYQFYLPTKPLFQLSSKNNFGIKERVFCLNERLTLSVCKGERGRDIERREREKEREREREDRERERVREREREIKRD